MDNPTPGRRHADQNAPEKNNIGRLTEERSTESNAIDIPQISLPKGGGALKGIDEKFEVNAANGTSSLSIPLPISPGRNGFAPSLGLQYNSGEGNGPFGQGWSLSLPSIQRKTDKQLPRYLDSPQEDTFLFSGAEDLVPYMKPDGLEQVENEIDGYRAKRYRPRVEGGFARIEKIIPSDISQGFYWKVTTRENITTFFGLNTAARIADPKDPSRIFQWLPDFSFDDKGNWLQYHYKRDSNFDEEGELHDEIDLPDHLFEKNRKAGLAPYTNTYLKRIRYGNRFPYYLQEVQAYAPSLPDEEQTCFFELVLDYGEHNEDEPTPKEDQRWTYRPDAFSSYRSGFEIRTQRLCRRILMFHHFEEEQQFAGTPEAMPFDKDYLVRSLELSYTPSSINGQGASETTYLSAAVQTGYIRKSEGKYAAKSLPPMEFTYQVLTWNTEPKKVAAQNIVNAPVGLSNNYQWVDLYGEGISGILTEQGQSWWYKPNYGNIPENGGLTFGMAQEVVPKPSLMGLSGGSLSIQDLEGNGHKQLVVNSPELKGYFELTRENGWETFQEFAQEANIVQGPQVRRIDLNGDGLPELVISEENAFIWYPNDGKRGHQSPEFTAKAVEEEQGPAIVFADQEEAIFLADLSGDGLTDIARIRNGEICYWANMGYGQFSAKVNMDNAPWFDHPDLFDPKYLHLADVSGTGVTDILYLGKNTFQAYINLSGNAWSTAHEIDPFFPVDDQVQLSVVDLLGTGTSCIVWSSPLPTDADAPMRYFDLMDSRKPHVLIAYKNNFGKETEIEYKSSTHYYLKDKLGGTPWISKLPFPVQVVSKMTVLDRVTEVRFTSQYQYHHGYYDHLEREFRGFGRVDQIDTEDYDIYLVNTQSPAQSPDRALFQFPVLTKTWYHTGAFLDREHLLTQYQKEYWSEEIRRAFPEEKFQVNEPELPDAELSEETKTLRGDDFREALRACKGMVLRQEVFALDASAAKDAKEGKRRQLTPYTVATHNCHIQQLQAKRANEFGVFLVTESEALTIHYERKLDWHPILEYWVPDPRIAHSLNIEIDNLGNVLQSASIVYGRGKEKAAASLAELSTSCTDFSMEVLPTNETDHLTVKTKDELRAAFEANLEKTQLEQVKNHILYTENRFARYWKEITTDQGEKTYPYDINEPHGYRLRLPLSTQTHELTNIVPNDEGEIMRYNEPLGDIFSLTEVAGLFADAQEIEYHQPTSKGLEKRLIESVRTQYRKNDLDILPFGFYDSVGLPYQNFQLAYTPALADVLFSKVEEEDQHPLMIGDTAAAALLEQEGRFSDLDEDGRLWIRSGIIHFQEEGEDSTQVQQRFYSPIAFEDPFGAKTTVTYDRESFTDEQRNNDGYYLYIKRTEDAIGNRITIDRFDFRSLSPSRMIDLNANPSSVLLDELGMVKAIATEGNGYWENEELQLEKADELAGLKPYPMDEEDDFLLQLFAAGADNATDTHELMQAAGALLRGVSVRFFYDFERYKKGEGPTVALAITRAEHFSQNPESPLQLQLEYSGGMGNVVLAKVQAEPGLACYMENGASEERDTGTELRWIGNGRTILNNKGKAVKQYEPYFSTHFGYENEAALVECGVTPFLYYDPLGRLIQTDFPDGTFSRVAFDAWQQQQWDQNDTVLNSDWHKKRTEEIDTLSQELTELFQLNLADEEQQNWLSKLVDAQATAAEQAAWHNETPASLHLDALGRPVLSVAHNGGAEEGTFRLYTTFIQLDVEGNARAVLDARGNTVMAYQYDLLGHRVYEQSMDAGERWMMNNVMGKPVHLWDAKGQRFSTAYDAIQRPKKTYLHLANVLDPFLIESVTYGEGLSDAEQRNLRGQSYEILDSSGKLTTTRLDFKGNPLEVQRQLAAAFDSPLIDWSEGAETNQLEEEKFSTAMEYDALNRVVRKYNWHRSSDKVTIVEPRYNERNLLLAQDLISRAQRTENSYSGGDRSTLVVEVIYDAKGQRRRLKLGNSTTTCYHYDQQTFRLIQLRTIRNSAGCHRASLPNPLANENVLQNLLYTYDPVGNIAEVIDTAYEPVFFNNQKVEPRSRYTYDAIYQLIAAEGRENLSRDSAPTAHESHPLSHSFPVTDKTLRNYTQFYTYDPVGNILKKRHTASEDRWTRRYAYHTDSNRLHQSWRGSHTTEAVTYTYDEHGNMLNYDNSPDEFLPQWNYEDRIHRIDLGGGGQAFYQYDTSLERSRKRIIRQEETVEERLYLGGVELYRRWNEVGTLEEIETHHVMLSDERVLLFEEVIQTDTDLPIGLLFRYQYSNHLDSTSLELNELGAIISYEEYYPYGTTAYRAVNSDVKATKKRYRYTGMERDEESGLNYHSARYYMPWLGRWASADPAGLAGGSNFYGYSLNNPIGNLDREGRTPEKPQGLWGKVKAFLTDPEYFNKTRKEAGLTTGAEQLQQDLGTGKRKLTKFGAADVQGVLPGVAESAKAAVPVGKAIGALVPIVLGGAGAIGSIRAAQGAYFAGQNAAAIYGGVSGGYQLSWGIATSALAISGQFETIEKTSSFSSLGGLAGATVYGVTGGDVYEGASLGDSIQSNAELGYDAYQNLTLIGDSLKLQAPNLDVDDVPRIPRTETGGVPGTSQTIIFTDQPTMVPRLSGGTARPKGRWVGPGDADSLAIIPEWGNRLDQGYVLVRPGATSKMEVAAPQFSKKDNRLYPGGGLQLVFDGVKYDGIDMRGIASRSSKKLPDLYNYPDFIGYGVAGSTSWNPKH